MGEEPSRAGRNVMEGTSPSSGPKAKESVARYKAGHAAPAAHRAIADHMHWLPLYTPLATSNRPRSKEPHPLSHPQSPALCVPSGGKHKETN